MSKNSAIPAPLVGPLGGSITLGGFKLHSALGQCGSHTFAPGDCQSSASGATVRCRQP